MALAVCSAFDIGRCFGVTIRPVCVFGYIKFVSKSTSTPSSLVPTSSSSSLSLYWLLGLDTVDHNPAVTSASIPPGRCDLSTKYLLTFYSASSLLSCQMSCLGLKYFDSIPPWRVCCRVVGTVGASEGGERRFLKCFGSSCWVLRIYCMLSATCVEDDVPCLFCSPDVCWLSRLFSYWLLCTANLAVRPMMLGERFPLGDSILFTTVTPIILSTSSDAKWCCWLDGKRLTSIRGPKPMFF